MEIISQLKRVSNKITSVYIYPISKIISKSKKFVVTSSAASILLLGAAAIRNNFSQISTSIKDEASEELGCLPITEPTIR